MDIRTMANSAIQSVNSDSAITIKRSIGYTIGAGQKQIPQYEEFSGQAQIQALDGKSLQKVNGLNMQGVARAVYLTGELHGIIRADSFGGDLIEWNGKTWLVVLIIETWDTWTKAAIVEQING